MNIDPSLLDPRSPTGLDDDLFGDKGNENFANDLDPRAFEVEKREQPDEQPHQAMSGVVPVPPTAFPNPND